MNRATVLAEALVKLALEGDTTRSPELPVCASTAVSCITTDAEGRASNVRVSPSIAALPVNTLVVDRTAVMDLQQFVRTDADDCRTFSNDIMAPTKDSVAQYTV